MTNTNTVVGIVAEYNPLHNGHYYMMRTVKEKFPDAACVVVLGSNFTQRGTPAIVDKWTRTRMALACGADLVFELPFLFACAAAPDFSAGAVDILARTHIATHIAFGMENPERDLAPMVNILLHEPLSFKRRLKKELDRGASYAKAMAIALTSELSSNERDDKNFDALAPDAIAPEPEARGSFLTSPNDLLALSYMLRVKAKNYNLTAVPVARVGCAHNDPAGTSEFASAAAIREALCSTLGSRESRAQVAREADGCAARESDVQVTRCGEVGVAPCEFDKAGEKLVPKFSRDLLQAAYVEGRLCLRHYAESKLWPLVQAMLLRSEPEALRRIDGVDEGLENLFLKRWLDAENFSDFVGRCTNARNTSGRIRRMVMRLMLGVDREGARATVRGGVPWARVLGANARGRALLRRARGESELPIVTRLADAGRNGGAFAAEIELRASRFYELLLPCSSGCVNREVRMAPIVSCVSACESDDE